MKKSRFPNEHFLVTKAQHKPEWVQCFTSSYVNDKALMLGSEIATIANSVVTMVDTRWRELTGITRTSHIVKKIIDWLKLEFRHDAVMVMVIEFAMDDLKPALVKFLTKVTNSKNAMFA